MKHILFVCTGNTCRSSMAEGLFKSALERRPEMRSGFSVSSAGVSASDGCPASAHAVKVLKDGWNIDISSHLSSSLTREKADKADYIFTMTRSHKATVLSMFPHARRKIFTLKEFINSSPVNRNFDNEYNEYDYTLDIRDPFGGDVNVYKSCAAELHDAIEKLVEKLVLQ